MGRPPLDADSQTQATVVRLTVEQRARIAAVAPGVKLAEFIREAVEREIKRRSRAS